MKYDRVRAAMQRRIVGRYTINNTRTSHGASDNRRTFILCVREKFGTVIIYYVARIIVALLPVITCYFSRTTKRIILLCLGWPRSVYYCVYDYD